MRPRGLFVQKLIQFFEGMHLCECRFNEYPPQNQEKGEATTNESEMEPALPNEAPSEIDPPKATSSEAEDNEATKSLPLLHSSVFLVPSLQMLFELVGYRPKQQSVLEMAELCHRLLKVIHVLNHPLNINHSLRRNGCSLDDLTCLDHQRDVLDNVTDRRPLCNCSFSNKSDESEKKQKSCPCHRQTWPGPRDWARRIRRRSADVPTVRPFTPENEEAPKFFGPPTLAELLQKEKKQTVEAIETVKAIETIKAEVTNETSAMPCKPPIEASIQTTATALEAFNTSVEMTIREIQTSSLSPPPSPLTAQEDGERPSPSHKAKSNRLKRKFLAKLPSTSNETDERKIASELARKRFLQQRLSKKEMRRARRLFRDSINPSIFSQFCATKGEARCSERIEWKSDRMSKVRPVSPNIDMWATLAERDVMLETSLYKCDSEPTSQSPVVPPKTKAADEIDLNKLFLKRLANLDPIIPCCCCSCHYRFTGPHKTDVSTGVEVKAVDAETQTTSFASYDEPGIWTRRKESRTKSEGGIEKQSSVPHKALFGGTEEQPVPHKAVGGTEKQPVPHKAAERGTEKQPVRHNLLTGGPEKQSMRHVEGDTEKQPARHKTAEGGTEKRHNVTKRFRDFINEQTSCVTGNKQQRANDKQETMEYRQFLLSRFLEDSANHNAKPNCEAELPEPPKPLRKV